jgi:hypothetical protein
VRASRRTDTGPEALLRWAWEGQRWAAPLQTPDGRPVQVIDRGRPGRGAGPDYRDARLLVGEELLVGDVEFHRSERGWAEHGHEGDEAYRRVVLQVVFEGGRARAAGQGRAVLTVEGVLEGPWRRLEPLFLGASHPCIACRPRVRALGLERALALLAETGVVRLREKAARMAGEWSQEDGAAQALSAALLKGLALPEGHPALAEVARAVPWREVRSLLQAGAGRLAEAWTEAWASATQGRRPSMGRPANDVPRRLRGLAQVFQRLGEDPAAALAAILESGAPALEAVLIVPGAIGPGWAMELAANAVLPWAVAQAQRSGDPVALARAEMVFCSYPKRQEYARTRRLAEALFGPEGTRWTVTVAQLQGLLCMEKSLCPGDLCPFRSAARQGSVEGPS